MKEKTDSDVENYMYEKLKNANGKEKRSERLCTRAISEGKAIQKIIV